MDGYASQYLNEDETVIWEKAYNAQGAEHREFCELFGPNKIPENVGEFLGYFMPHKVICGEDLLRAAGTVTKKLSKWLIDKGYISSDSAETMTDRGAQASKNLPAAENLAKLLAAHADESVCQVSETIEGYFEVCAISDTSLVIQEMMGDVKMIVPVPSSVTTLCKPNWTISGSVGKFADGWQLVEVWNVYP